MIERERESEARDLKTVDWTKLLRLRTVKRLFGCCSMAKAQTKIRLILAGEQNLWKKTKKKGKRKSMPWLQETFFLLPPLSNTKTNFFDSSPNLISSIWFLLFFFFAFWFLRERPSCSDRETEKRKNGHSMKTNANKQIAIVNVVQEWSQKSNCVCVCALKKIGWPAKDTTTYTK